MNKNNSKKDAKAPDQIQAELIKGFQWTTSHSKLVIFAALALLFVGGAVTFVSYTKSQKEAAVQEIYFAAEKQYNEKKSNFEQAEQAAAKSKKDDKAPVQTPATGDLDKDYGTVVKSFESIVTEFPSSLGAQMAALNVSEIYLKYKKQDLALKALQTVQPGLTMKDALSALVLTQIGSVYAEQNNCKEAIAPWQKIVDSKTLAFAHDETRLRMALCFEAMNDMAKAEQIYSEISKKTDGAGADSSLARDAEKYLKLLKMKKTQTGSGT